MNVNTRNEHHLCLNLSFGKGAELLGFKNAMVIHRVDIADTESGNVRHLAVLKTEEGGRALIGVEEGQWREYDAMDLADAIAAAQRKLEFLSRALAKLTDPADYVYGPVTGEPEKVTKERLAEAMRRGQRWRPVSWLEDEALKDGWCYARDRLLFIEHRADGNEEYYSSANLGAELAIRNYGDMWIRLS